MLWSEITVTKRAKLVQTNVVFSRAVVTASSGGVCLEGMCSRFRSLLSFAIRRDARRIAQRFWHHGAVPSDQNAIQGDFGEAWLEVVAAGCGLLHGRPATLDLQKADVQLTLQGWIGRTYNPTVMVQVKTEVGLSVDQDGSLVYNLDVPTYDVLRRDDHSVRRVLAVVGLVKESASVRVQEDGTLLVGRGAWVSLEGYPETTNKTSQVVRVPAGNTLDEPGLHRMLGTYGVRRTFPVPVDDPWE